MLARLARPLALIVALAAGLGSLAGPARADRPPDAPAIVLHGYAQLWWTIHEGAPTGLRQPGSQDTAAGHASGFQLRRVRLSADFRLGDIRGRLSARLEGTPIALLDAYAVVPLRAGIAELRAGQMKIPSTYEVELPKESLDFATLGHVSEVAADYALSRSPSPASKLTGVRCYDRDLGVGLQGTLRPLRYFLMVGNGLGANRFIGGPSTRQDVYANSFGACFYGARLGCSPLPMIDVGAHASWNNHPNAVLDDRRTVLDIRRAGSSVDLRVTPVKRLQLIAMYGNGRVLDDIDHDGRTDYRYHGWEARLLAQLVPDRLRLGLRHDTFADESYENGREDFRRTETAGVSWFPRPGVRLQAEYQHNVLDSDTDPDLDDDLFLLTGQLEF